jgi:predicted TIM-barrel fold metal-dependent hydrolase
MPARQLVIDVDSHFEPGNDWLVPYPELAAKLPALDMTRIVTDSVVGELLRDVPEAQRPPLASLKPPGVELMFGREKVDEQRRRAEFGERAQMPVANARARLEWIDQQGIDIQNVICLSGVGAAKLIDDVALRIELVQTCNTWLADVCAESNGRLLPVSAIDFTDLDLAVAELTRMRGRGSRIFMIPARPVNGASPAHPSWDRLWSAATDLGMVAMHHVSDGFMRFDPGWGNVGGDTTLMRQIGGSHYHVMPMTLLYSLIYAGVFERHPKLTVLLAEVGVGWLPFLSWDIDHVCSQHADLMLGKWTLPMKPSEYLARNVRGTPLTGAVGGGDQQLLEIMAQLPEDMIVFSTDFPHFEGIHDPASYYRQRLAPLSQTRRDRFYGGAIGDVYARMGDPLG